MVETSNNIDTITLSYPDIQSGHSFTNVLLIDSQVTNYQVFVDSVNSSTFPIVYSSVTTKGELTTLLQSYFNNIERIALCFLGNAIQQDICFFLDFEPFFTHDNIEGGEPSGENMEWIISTINTFHVKNIDYLACDTLQYSSWSAYYSTLTQATGVIVGASDDKTGNIKYGGDWIMESTMENIESVYFAESISYYSYLLDGIYNTGRNLTYIYNTSNSTASVRATIPANTPRTIEIPMTIHIRGKIYSVTSIGNNGFFGALNLTSIFFNGALKEIKERAFHNALNLKSIHFPASVWSVGNNAFNPSGLTTLKLSIGGQLTQVGSSAFPNGTSVTVSSGVTFSGGGSDQYPRY